MDFTTSDLCDQYTDLVDVLEPIFAHYGGISSFFGKIRTVKCFEDNSLIEKVLSEDGTGQVLLVDGGGSIRRALISVELAEMASANNWSGIICNGAVRDVDDLDEAEVGILALASIPVGAAQDGIGVIDAAVNFAGVTFLPDDYIYADSTGVILSPEPLELDEDDDLEDV
ncbi:ribonuclease E activity regulator RraA [Catenovulum sp. SM1970]|uniref:ribonuclease E activity regulator RraA n=1 Tax=Marinifaba aquimaris TaxID=2741323 RepID=UPI001573D680|nr:ribonuclease E activity regulator RraA [Marinifaba aquimaris]NTS77225.1 ribonuclease E activity regulator RraA [Marinifaba aquimaris]